MGPQGLLTTFCMNIKCGICVAGLKLEITSLTNQLWRFHTQALRVCVCTFVHQRVCVRACVCARVRARGLPLPLETAAETHTLTHTP